MALIIKGDMPKGCAYCFTYDDEYCQCRLEHSYDGHWSRENHCPILGEIPDKHGDLIDRMSLIHHIEENFDSDEAQDIIGLILAEKSVVEATE